MSTSNWTGAFIQKRTLEELSQSGFKLVDGKWLAREGGFYFDLHFAKLPSSELGTVEFDVPISLGLPVWKAPNVEDPNRFLGFLRPNSLSGSYDGYSFSDGDTWEDCRLRKDLSGHFKALVESISDYESAISFLLTKKKTEIDGFEFKFDDRNINPLLAKAAAYRLAVINGDHQMAGHCLKLLKGYPGLSLAKKREVEFLLPLLEV